MNILAHEKAYRSDSLLQKIASTNITVCGCGALGSNLIDNMVRQGFKKITVIDMDRIEEHNSGTQIWDKPEVGTLKADRMKHRVYTSTAVVIESIAKELTEDNINKFLKNSQIVIDTFDNPPSRKLIYDFCKNKKIHCLHTGLFQDYAETIWNENYIVPKGTRGIDVCEYPLARNIVLLAVAITTEVLIDFIDKGHKNNFSITLKDKKISKLET